MTTAIDQDPSSTSKDQIDLTQFNCNARYIQCYYKYTYFSSERRYHKDAAVVTDSVEICMLAIFSLGKELAQQKRLPRVSTLLKERLIDYCIKKQKDVPWWLFNDKEHKDVPWWAL
jgi:hypothetical protein